MESWQARILASNLPVDDAKNWSLRNMAKFSRLNAERLALAQRASTLEELDLVLLDAPIGAGSQLDVLMANHAGDISMMGARNVAKSSPATSPAAYAGLVFTATTTCRILDTRPSQGGSGAWAAGSSNLVKIGPYSTAGGGYATGPGAQGGSATSCGLDALAGPGQIAVIMAAVSTVSQVGAGYLTFYPQGAPNPGTTSVSQWYQPGYVQTSFVLIPGDLVGTVAASAFTSTSTDVIIDVLGYFAAETNDGVTSITAGTGLTGGTITSTGTVAIATAYQLPQSCANGQVAQSNGGGIWSCAQSSYTAGTGLNLSGSTFAVAGSYQLPQSCTNGQVAQSNGAGSWSCVTPVVSGGTVTGVSASAPLASSGGNTPNISLTGTIPVANGGTGQTTLAANGIVFGQDAGAVSTTVGIAGQVLAGTAGAPAWTGSPSISGNLTLVNPSTASGGNIMKAGDPFIHNFGTNNTFIGVNAGNFTMTGISNTASGFQALAFNTTGSSNTASGSFALFSNSNGLSNTASGRSALQNNTTGNSNTASGLQALAFNTTGIGNIALGALAGSNLTTGNFNIDIGNAGVAAEGNTIRIGDGNQLSAFIAGISGAISSGGVAVYVNSSGQLGTLTSSRRFKDDIADMDAASSALMKLRPVTFHYKVDQNASGRTLQYGLIAEEVDEVYPGLVAHSADGQVETVMYQFLPPMLLNEYQKQQRTIEKQTARIAEFERERQTLKAVVAEIAELKQQTAHLARLLDQQRTGAVTAGLGLK